MYVHPVPLLVSGCVNDIGSTLVAAYRIFSLIIGSSIRLRAIVPNRPLRLTFSFYVIRISRTCVGTLLKVGAVLTTRTMSTASPRLPAAAPAFQKRVILLSASLGALTGPWNSAAAVLSYAVHCLTVVVCIILLIVCHCCIGTFIAQPSTMIAMLSRAWLARRGVRRDICIEFPGLVGETLVVLVLVPVS